MSRRGIAQMVNAPKNLAEELAPHLARLPIFPLQRVQLFPRALLPLYVFEPRYRELVEVCLARGGVMAVATLRRKPDGSPLTSEEYVGRPPVRQMVGAGKIVAHRRNPDGTYNILLSGLLRVRIEAELPPEHLFREVSGHAVRDRWPRSFSPESARQTLVVLTERLAGLLPEGGDALRSLGRSQKRPGRLVDLLAAALVTRPGLRLRLLETADVARRCEWVSGEIARLVARLQRGGETGAN